MSEQARLTAIEQWLQREEDEVLYAPDCGDGSPSQGTHSVCDEALTRITLSYCNAAPHVWGVVEEVRDDGRVLVRVGEYESRAA